jgi:hypothetical protein
MAKKVKIYIVDALRPHDDPKEDLGEHELERTPNIGDPITLGNRNFKVERIAVDSGNLYLSHNLWIGRSAAKIVKSANQGVKPGVNLRKF